MVLVELHVASIDMQKEPHQIKCIFSTLLLCVDEFLKKINIHFAEIFLAINIGAAVNLIDVPKS